ncbi:hypothetical protein [Anaerococcus sp.]|uniref:hypothetical protein n=1 Tax=Anaerococcus sp. TaxID=1872515 RepID=UPI0027BAC6B9|nr:hypothetical protein [Anaerococcus sp.]
MNKKKVLSLVTILATTAGLALTPSSCFATEDSGVGVYDKLGQKANIDKQSYKIISQTTSNEYPKAFASFTNDPPGSNDKVGSLNDGIIDMDGSKGNNRWTTWQRNALKGNQYIGVIFGDKKARKQEVSGLSLSFFEDNGTKMPQKIRVEYYVGPKPEGIKNHAHIADEKDNSFNNPQNWKSVENLRANNLDRNKTNDISFDKVETFAIRIVMLPPEGKSLAVTELQAWGKDYVKKPLELTKLKDLYEKALKLDKDDYTYTSYKNLVKILPEIDKVLKSEDLEQEDVDKAFEKLKESIGSLASFNKANKDELENLIKKAESFKKNKYTQESFNELQEELVYSKSVLKNKRASQLDVDKAVEYLQKYIKNLVEVRAKADTSQLKECLAYAESFNLDEYGDESRLNLEVAIKNAKETLKDPSLAQDVVDKIYEELLDKIFKLEEKEDEVQVDKSKLLLGIDLANDLLADKSKTYEEGSLELVKKSFEKAEEVYKSKGASKTEVDNAYFDLLEAIMNIDQKQSSDLRDGSKLKELLESIEKSDLAKSDKLAKACVKAKEVYDKAGSSQDDINKAYEDILGILMTE